MDQFHFENFDSPASPNVKRFLNKFFIARYGMFTCSNAPRIFGELDYEVGLIERIEKRNLKRIWNIALMSAVYNKDVSWEAMYD